MKKSKIKVTVYEAKDGYRWNMKRCGRIIAESGEAYKRYASIRKVLFNLLDSLKDSKYDMFYPPVK